MNITITPSLLSGSVDAIPSKSCAHRALICAAFAEGNTKLNIRDVNADIEATAECLNALGAQILRHDWGYVVTPAAKIPETAVLHIRESGSTLRFLLPVCGVLGVNSTFLLEGRLPQRPLSPLWEEMERMGCKLRLEGNVLHLTGKLQPGTYRIAGNVSSQFISGLLFAGAIAPGIRVEVLGKLESKPYVDMTLDALHLFGVDGDDFAPKGKLTSPGEIIIEGDWSNGAFFLTAQALGNPVNVSNLNPDSSQGDKAVVECLEALKASCTVSAADIPDLIPILSIMAACREGAVFTDIGRLRLKESDRVAAIENMIAALGGRTESTESTLTVYGTGLTGGTVDSCNDHRIAMAAAIAATRCRKKVTILGAQAVNKSYPKFWEDYGKLGGNYEQYLR